MADNQNRNEYEQYKDQTGLLYQTRDGTPPLAGTRVTFTENGQQREGTYSGGTVQKDK